MHVSTLTISLQNSDRHIMCHLLSILLAKFEFIIRFFPCRPATRISKKKKLKINIHRPVGTRVVFDEEGNTQPPLAKLADTKNVSGLLDQIEGMYYKSVISNKNKNRIMCQEVIGGRRCNDLKNCSPGNKSGK